MSLLSNLNTSTKTRSSLSQDTFDELRGYISEQTGIYFRDNKRYLLESQVGRRLKALGVPSYEEYVRLIQNGRQSSELPKLVNAVTINETFFFRHPKQYQALANELIPSLIENKRGLRKLRIWSAACSTGDEPYTLALLLKDQLLPKHPRLRLEIVGTDINTDVLDTARSGVYGSYAVRNIPDTYLRKYFTPEGDHYTLSPEIRRLVTFRHLNLMDDRAMRRMRNFDVILCANVLIYFDEPTKQQVTGNLYKSLTPGGYLFVGTSETLHGVTRAFQPVRLHNTIAYQKAD
jgi:chemotaxis protein methyltransferase CheR